MTTDEAKKILAREYKIMMDDDYYANCDPMGAGQIGRAIETILVGGDEDGVIVEDISVEEAKKLMDSWKK